MIGNEGSHNNNVVPDVVETSAAGTTMTVNNSHRHNNDIIIIDSVVDRTGTSTSNNRHHHYHHPANSSTSSSSINNNNNNNNVDGTYHSSFSSSQEVLPTLRRSSLASTGTITSSVSISSNIIIQPYVNGSNATTTAATATLMRTTTGGLAAPTSPEDEQYERRRNIKAIMKDPTLSEKEKSKKIQALMDGRGQLMNQQQQSNNNNNSSSGSVHNGIGNNRRGSMSSYCSNASSVYASSMAQVAADVACETSMYFDNYDASFHTNRSYSYSVSSQTNNPDYEYIVNSSNNNSNNNLAVNELQQQQQQRPSDPLGSYKQYHGRSKSLQDWTDSDRANAAAHTTVFGNRIQHVSRLMEQSRPACEHYERNCTVVSPCCGLAFGCRICHDDCPILPPPIVYQRRLSANAAVAATTTTTKAAAASTGSCNDSTTGRCCGPAVPRTTTYCRNVNDASSMNAIADTKPLSSSSSQHGMVRHMNKLERRKSLPNEFTTERKPEDDHHLIDRFAIREVICRHCYTRQSSKTNKCISCSIQFGQYHCDICNLWMSDVESPYHCDDCGFCRVGGRDNFRHCNDCGMCIDTLLFDDHNCKSGKYMSDCPICQEDLFSSRFASHEMPCGHAIHWHCFTELTSYDTRCPVCKKTVESPERMEATWNSIAVGIALQPVPPEMARMVNILCNDCETTSHNNRWHFLGVRCPNCSSFNTTEEQIVMQGHDAAAYLDRIEQINNGQRIGDVPTDISLPTRFLGVQNDQYAMNDDDSSDDSMSEGDNMEE